MSDEKQPDSGEPCPNYVFLKRGVEGEFQLEIPQEYQSEFKPISEATYKRWLKEKSEDPEALAELDHDEMDLGEEEGERTT